MLCVLWVPLLRATSPEIAKWVVPLSGLKPLGEGLKPGHRAPHDLEPNAPTLKVRAIGVSARL